MVFSKQLSRFARWLRSDIADTQAASTASCSATVSEPAAPAVAVSRRSRGARVRSRSIQLERMESRLLMTADPIWVGGVYVEEDGGADTHGDSFYVTFKGGAAGTELTRLTIDGDHNAPGFGFGDMIFDTLDGGLGADHAFAFQVTKLITADPTATVTASVQDGSSRLVLDFTNFHAGDTLVFSIDVDEVQQFDPNETDLDAINSGIDPIASGVEFQDSNFKAEFKAPHYEDITGQNKFKNFYDPMLVGTDLSLPADNADGKRDRSAGTALTVQQVPKPITLAGIVYVDNNTNLKIDNGETLLPNVELELFRLENGSYVSTGLKTTTNSQGAYKFGADGSLQPGTYQVREKQPDGYYSVGATIGLLEDGTLVGKTVADNPDMLTDIQIPLGDEHATQLNFAEAQPATLAGRVVLVRNAFSCDDPTAIEEPIAGVTVEIRNAAGDFFRTTVTDSDGRYSFTNLKVDTFTITEITPAGLLEGDAHVGTINTTTVGIAADGSRITQISVLGGNDGVNYDFCEVVPSNLSGYVYVDNDDDGVRDNGERPIGDVKVILWDEAGQQVAETRTDSRGYYHFDNIPPGHYRITEEQPAGYLPGKATAGTINGIQVGKTDPTGNVIREIELRSGLSGVEYDFGELLPGSIAGRVIVDTNGNCIIDAVGEQPLAGVKIELLDHNGQVLQTTFTDSNGEYQFLNLAPNEYQVRETQPAGYFQAGQHSGSGGGDDSAEDVIRAIPVHSGDALIEYLFCEIPPADLSGYVFVDRNDDCMFDSNEQPIVGTRVTLYDDSGALIGTAFTDATGKYVFNNLKPGRYTVREEQPAGYLQGGQMVGSGNGDASVPDVISAIDIGAGQSLVDYNFCEKLPGSIQGKVFVDLNFDCIQDANEQPLEGVEVLLLDKNGAILRTTKTDASGHYSFNDLVPGEYTVREMQPDGYFQGGTVAPATGGNASIQDQISELILSGIRSAMPTSRSAAGHYLGICLPRR
ncbi:MAG: SdrD B-like domain-containing protein [Pirellulales bacterium]